MTANTLTSFIHNTPKLRRSWHRLSTAIKREIANRASEIKVEADFLRVLAEVRSGQASLF